jgi:hypothetical protein
MIQQVVNARKQLRYDVVECVVTKYLPYGLAVRSVHGESGFVDSGDIADSAVSSEDWPMIGARLDCVVLGYTNEGRLRAAAAAGYVRLIRALDEPAVRLREWSAICGSLSDGEAVRRFFESPAAGALIEWGLKRPEGSVTRSAANDLWTQAPESVRMLISSPDDRRRG